MANEHFEIEYSPGDIVKDPEHGRGEIIECLLTLRMTRDAPHVVNVTITYQCEFPDGEQVQHNQVSIAGLVEKKEKPEVVH